MNVRVRDHHLLNAPLINLGQARQLLIAVSESMLGQESLKCLEIHHIVGEVALHHGLGGAVLLKVGVGVLVVDLGRQAEGLAESRLAEVAEVLLQPQVELLSLLEVKK